MESPGFSSQFSFWSWAKALPRLVLSSRTSFAKFLRVTFCIRERGQPALDTALFPSARAEYFCLQAGAFHFRLHATVPFQLSRRS